MRRGGVLENISNFIALMETQNSNTAKVVKHVFKNIDKETQGYDFTKSQNNFNNLCQEYMDFVKLSSEDRTSLTNYINNDLAYLSQYNQSDNEIAEIKEMYKGVSLEEQQAKHKNNYKEKIMMLEQRAQQEMRNSLILVSSPSNLKSSKINTTAFYRGR